MKLHEKKEGMAHKMKDEKNKAIEKKKHKELVKKFRRGEIGGQEVFEHGIKTGTLPKLKHPEYPL